MWYRGRHVARGPKAVKALLAVLEAAVLAGVLEGSLIAGHLGRADEGAPRGLSWEQPVFRNPLPETDSEGARRLDRGEMDETISQALRQHLVAALPEDGRGARSPIDVSEQSRSAPAEPDISEGDLELLRQLGDVE